MSHPDAPLAAVVLLGMLCLAGCDELADSAPEPVRTTTSTVVELDPDGVALPEAPEQEAAPEPTPTVTVTERASGTTGDVAFVEGLRSELADGRGEARVLLGAFFGADLYADPELTEPVEVLGGDVAVLTNPFAVGPRQVGGVEQVVVGAMWVRDGQDLDLADTYFTAVANDLRADLGSSLSAPWLYTVGGGGGSYCRVAGGATIDGEITNLRVDTVAVGGDQLLVYDPSSVDGVLPSSPVEMLNSAVVGGVTTVDRDDVFGQTAGMGQNLDHVHFDDGTHPRGMAFAPSPGDARCAVETPG